jgi:hypothetical protein
MNVKLIDYNFYTLYDIEADKSILQTDTNKEPVFWKDTLTFNKDGVKNLHPNYFQNKHITLSDLYKYDKYSIPGIINFIKLIKFKPFKYYSGLLGKEIDIITSQDIINYLKLEDSEYNNVSSYERIINFFQRKVKENLSI